MSHLPSTPTHRPLLPDFEIHETFSNADENTSQCLCAQRARAGLWLLEFRIE